MLTTRKRCKSCQHVQLCKFDQREVTWASAFRSVLYAEDFPANGFVEELKRTSQPRFTYSEPEREA